MRCYYLYIMCLLVSCYACSEREIEPTPLPITQQGDLLYLNLRSGGTDLPPVGDYGIYCIEHASGTTVSWNAPFYLENTEGHFDGDELTLTGNPRYPINDSLSVFLYYPYNVNNADVQPQNIKVDRKEIKNNLLETISYKYPDYLAGDTTISVIGGVPEIPSEATVRLRHLMSRIRFQINNSGTDNITLTSIKLKNITWQGTINPLMASFFVPDASATTETLTLIENFLVGGAAVGSETKPQHIQIDPIYNYSDEEASKKDVYDKNFYYYLLVPPLNEADLKNVTLEIDFIRYGSNYTVTVEMKQINIASWQSGNSYCYTIVFNTYAVDYVDVRIEPWKEELYIGKVDLE